MLRHLLSFRRKPESMTIKELAPGFMPFRVLVPFRISAGVTNKEIPLI
jgi:hypothetical protein